MRFVKTDWSPGYMKVCPRHTAIEVVCLACGLQKPFDRETVPKLLQHAFVEEVEARLKCSSCGAKAAKLIFGYHTSDPVNADAPLPRA